MRNLLKQSWCLAVGLLLMGGIAVAADAPAPAPGQPAAVKGAEQLDVEATYTGKVQVTKEGTTVKAIVLVIDAQTSYPVKLNPNGLKLADFDGKTVDVKGIMRKVAGALLLTARTVTEPAAAAPKP